MQIVVIGVDHRTAAVEVRERLAFAPEQVLRLTAELRGAGILREAVVLSTCNRSEVYGVAPHETANVAESVQSSVLRFHQQPENSRSDCFYRLRDREVVRHLFRVASGLDSMLLGEAEILGQVRQAYKAALGGGSTGPVLNRLFQSALEVGKRVRTQTDLGTRPMSVAFAGVKLAERIFGRLDGRKALIVGAGAMAQQVGEHLRDRGVTRILVANRSRERGEELARGVDGELVEWTALPEALETPEIVLTAVGAAGPVLTREQIARAMAARRNGEMFLIDLGVPRNIEPAAGQLYNVYLYTLDDLTRIVEQNLQARKEEIPRAEAIVAEHVAKFQMWLTSMEVVALARRLRESVQHEREQILHERLRRLGHLTPEERSQAAALLGALVDRILQEPAEEGRDPHAVLRHITRELDRFSRLVEEKP